MKNVRKHYIREWRKFRGVSLRKLAARMESEPGGEEIISYASINRIEKHEQPFSEPILYALADALDVEAWMLLKVNPLKEGTVIDMVSRLTPDEQAKLSEMLKAFKAV